MNSATLTAARGRILLGACGIALIGATTAHGAAAPPPPGHDPTSPAPVAVVAPAEPQGQTAGRTGNPLAGRPFYVDPNSRAREQVQEWARSRPADARQMRKIADRPTSFWFGGWNGDVRRAVNDVVRRAAAARATPVLVAYYIPHRDCAIGNSGAAPNAAAYRAFIDTMATGIGSRPAVVIIEPDALASISCVPAGRARAERLAMLRYAATRLSRQPATQAYIDAGHAEWVPARQMGPLLRKAGVTAARGFSLNVANFWPTAPNLTYGRTLSRMTGGSRFVIDTGRNGRGNLASNWCNPPGRGLGTPPTTTTGYPLADAFLWVKPPGDSDGTCNGGPGGGRWWADYALGLAKRSLTP